MCVSLWQSFVIAVIVIVAATFSTGIDSKCLQVRALLLSLGPKTELTDHT